MTKGTDLKAVKDDKIFCELTLDQIDEINQKIHFVLSTLDILRSIDISIELNIESLITLAYEAHDRLKEVSDILNPEENKKDN